MTINIAAGAAAYANAAKGAATVGPTVKATGTGFGDLLESAIGGAVQDQTKAETATLSAAAGKADINNVVAAVNNAEVSLQTVLAVRDKIISAYTEILHMQV